MSSAFILSFDGGPTLPESLLPLVEELSGTVENLKILVNKMKRWTEFANGIQDLLVAQGAAERVIFQVMYVTLKSRDCITLYPSC